MKCKMIIGCAVCALIFISCNNAADSSDYGVDSTATFPNNSDVQPDSAYAVDSTSTADSSAGGGSGRSSSRSKRYNLPSDTPRR